MIRSAKRPDSKSNWKVLVTDKVTRKILSNSCTMSELTEEGVSLVEEINKRRQPLPNFDAVYFIQPTIENVIILLSDMAGTTPLYREAYIFFSSTVSKELVARIKREPTIRSRFRAMKELNLEYFVIDSQCFITDYGKALEDLYVDKEINQKGEECLAAMANRIATVFASLSEFPFVRYRAAKSLDLTTMTTFSDLIPTKLASYVWNCLVEYKTLKNFPQTETCELLILDRSIDQVAPVIHEWTYDAMCHDLLEMDGNKYVHEVPNGTGGFEWKEVLLDQEHDPVWLELRHSHIADASDRLHDKLTNFMSKNKAAQMHQGSREGDHELSTHDLQKLVQSLPQFSEQKEKLSLHADIAVKIHNIRHKTALNGVGKLEQDLVFGDAGTKDVINFLKEQTDITHECKVRLLMIYAATRPRKFESEKLRKLMDLANLSPDDMNAVYNMRFLAAAPESKMTAFTNAFSLKIHHKKKKHSLRTDRPGEEPALQLSRFHPMIEELIEKLSKNELPMNEYPCLNDPTPTNLDGTSHSKSARVHDIPGRSMRSRPSTWARPRSSDESDPVMSRPTREVKKTGKRIFVFIVGGATRSELRVCHELTTKLRREIILGSSSLDDPAQFVEKVKSLTPNDNEISLDDLGI
ncbi:SNARE-interacting protein KEULE-like [Bidens hawaiensis]|uniref:SNARE-interacting protein KEULE-like n=1 Tax=Bidens hawaiensis TaxID=980011 RepID=UPI0040490F69